MSETLIFPSVMVTGHRPKYFTYSQSVFVKDTLLKIARKCIKDYQTTELISGMALGSDTWWADIAIDLDLGLAAYIPFEQQPDRWRSDHRAHWSELRSKASREVIIADQFSVTALHERNYRMIADCDLAVAVWDQSVQSGGTFAAVRKLTRVEKPMILVDPITKKITHRNF